MITLLKCDSFKFIICILLGRIRNGLQKKAYNNTVIIRGNIYKKVDKSCLPNLEPSLST